MTTGEKIRFYRKLNHMTLEAADGCRQDSPMRPLVRPLDIKKEPTQPYLQGQIGNLYGAGDVLL